MDITAGLGVVTKTVNSASPENRTSNVQLIASYYTVWKIQDLKPVAYICGGDFNWKD
jgi:hypothetical protein